MTIRIALSDGWEPCSHSQCPAAFAAADSIPLLELGVDGWEPCLAGFSLRHATVNFDKNAKLSLKKLYMTYHLHS
jgi:hypothetical protein